MCYFIKLEKVRPLTWRTFTMLVFTRDSYRKGPNEIED